MENDSPSPDEQIASPALTESAEPGSPALATDLEDSFFATRRLRHDGWDGPAMATFCRALAESGVVTEACRACGKAAKGAYALRQREPLFARAWESALSLARAAGRRFARPLAQGQRRADYPRRVHLGRAPRL